MAENFLKLNDDKTEFLLLSSKRQPIGHTTFKIGDCVVSPVPQARNIGAMFDQHLTLDSHINQICRTAFFHLHRIGLIRRFLTNDSAKTLVHAFVTSRLDHLNSLLVGLPACSTDKLQRVQNASARVISRTAKFDHITPVLNELHWLRIPERIEYKILLLCHKCISGVAPTYLQELLHVYCPTRSLRSCDSLLLVEQRERVLSYGGRAFQCAAPRLWNQLPAHIRKIESTPVFARHLKTFLFARYSRPS